ncbi:MAG: ribonuclease P protein component [Candidatus Limnocylindria bacterium]
MPAFPTIGRRADFDALARSGITSSCRLLVMRARRTDGEVTRIGMSTPRALGGAVVRNTVRRRLREALRARYATLPSGWDVLVIGRTPARDASTSELGASIDRLLERCGVRAA